MAYIILASRAIITVLLCIMSLVCYSKIMIKLVNRTNQIPKSYCLPKEDLLAKSILLCEQNGEPIYCTKCELFKPERTHHCRVCNKCAPKMDQ